MINLDKSMEIKKYIPSSIRYAINSMPEKIWGILNEINFITGQEITLKTGNKRVYLTKSGISNNKRDAIIVSKNDVLKTFELITESSLYAYNRFVRDGFLTLKGGHRVGIVGNCVCEDNKITNVNSINSLCFRIAHDIHGINNLVFDEIYDGVSLKSCIIVSPPGCGKTTLLRDIAFQLSNTNKIIKCVIIDERYEIAACYEGEASLNVGHVTGVISGCKKDIAIPVVVRSMSPDVILVDELASQTDINSVKYALASGCAVIATTHGTDEYNNGICYFEKKNVFNKIIVLSARNGPGTIEKITDGDIYDF